MHKPLDPVVIYARSFVETFGADCSARLKDVASSIGLSIKEVEAKTFDGALVRVAGKPLGKVVINSDIREEGRRLFTLAHEIGHYVLPAHSKTRALCRTRDVQNWAPGLPARELEANRFAAEILMPAALILNELRMEPSLRVVRLIASRFHTSLTASAYRLAELSSYRIAVVWSSSGRRVWYQTSEEFGRAVELGPVSPESFAGDCFRDDTVADHPESVPAAAWLYENGLVEGARIWEESITIPHYDAVLSLLYMREPIETEAEPPEEEAALDPMEFTLGRKRWPKK
ncbi:MAG: ImmA/IrrE family metallo-endopeptidase [Planctomycetota bacterium]